MEKKTLIAIALSFCVILLWQLLFVKPPVTPSPESGVAPPGNATEEVTTEVAPTVPTPAPGPVAAGEERIIEIESPLYIARVTTNEGRIASFSLKDYRETIEEDSLPVDIIPQELEKLSPKIAFDTNLGSFEENILYTTTADSDYITIGGDKGNDPYSLVLMWEGDNFRVEKTYIFHPDTYGIDVTFTITNRAENNMDGEMSVSLFEYLSTEKKGFRLFQNVEYPSNLIAYVDEGLKTEIVIKIKPEQEKTITGDVTWFGFDSKYFLVAAAVPEGGSKTITAVRTDENTITGTYGIGEFSVPAGGQIKKELVLYLGPKEAKATEAVGHSLDASINYGFFAFLSIPLVYLLKLFFSIVKNYGAAIIILTIVVRILLYPITYKSMKSMKELQKIQPLILAIRDKHKNNREKMNEEVMRLYQTHKINPLGGCLPLLLQIPVFIALYKALYVAIELRHSPFCLWIKDLSVMDPYYVTPIVMGLSYFVQQKMTPTTADPIQQKVMMLMPVIFTVIFLNLPSGLVLYFFVSNLLSIGQQFYMNKFQKD